MLPKKFRLPGNQIPEVLKRGKQFSFPLFNLVYYQPPATSPQPPAPRFAFVVSTKISKKAVVRNRTKRLFSESVRLLLPKIKGNQDIIVFAKKPLREEKLQDVLPRLERAFKKIKIV